MPNLTSQFSRKEIETSLEHIIDEKIELIGSTRWLLQYKNKVFPPKEVVRWAARLKKLPYWETMRLSGGSNTNEPLKKLGFTIVDKTAMGDPNKNLIEQYKQILKKTGFSDEAYKWWIFRKKFTSVPG